MLLTRKIKEAGRYLELPVVDHLIVTTEGYYSFADEGVLWHNHAFGIRPVFD